MDGKRFDALTRRLADATPRRRLFAATGSTIASIVLGRTVKAVEDCKKVGRRCDRSSDCCAGANCVDDECACKDGRTECNGLCYRLDSDEANCGACGVACAAGETCCAGVCTDRETDPANCGGCGIGCGAGKVCCAGACVGDLDANVDHCGACGNRCPGQCTLNPDGFRICHGPRCCAVGSCIDDVQSNPDHCGACGNRCAGICTTGPDGIKRCHGPRCCANGACVEEFQSNPDHCGACGNACTAGDVCCDGTCLDPAEAKRCDRCGNVCADGLTCCDGYCTDLQTDHYHCGTCTTRCNYRVNKPPYEYCCNGRCLGDLDANPNHCGACNNRCPGTDCCRGVCCPQGTICIFDSDLKELGCFPASDGRLARGPGKGETTRGRADAPRRNRRSSRSHNGGT